MKARIGKEGFRAILRCRYKKAIHVERQIVRLIAKLVDLVGVTQQHSSFSAQKSICCGVLIHRKRIGSKKTSLRPIFHLLSACRQLTLPIGLAAVQSLGIIQHAILLRNVIGQDTAQRIELKTVGFARSRKRNQPFVEHQLHERAEFIC